MVAETIWKNVRYLRNPTVTRWYIYSTQFAEPSKGKKSAEKKGKNSAFQRKNKREKR